MDTTLVDFNDMKWERGDISFIFNGEAKPSQSLTVLDNKLKVFQRIRYEVSSSSSIPQILLCEDRKYGSIISKYILENGGAFEEMRGNCTFLKDRHG